MQKRTIIITIVILTILAILFVFYSKEDESLLGPGETPTSLSDEGKTQVQTFLNQNITELSPQEAVLGGTFYVTNVTFHNGNSATVYYEDGHIALEADVEFTVSDDGTVNINSFRIKETNGEQILEESNFHEVGAITRGGTTGWRLVYEEPGKPALTASLAFTDTSQCREKDDWTPCTPSEWPEGAQVEVFGTKKGEVVAIHTLKLPLAKNPGENIPPETTGPDLVCEDLCGDGTCQEIVCMGTGCPCAETPVSCPSDCGTE